MGKILTKNTLLKFITEVQFGRSWLYRLMALDHIYLWGRAHGTSLPSETPRGMNSNPHLSFFLQLKVIAVGYHSSIKNSWNK